MRAAKSIALRLLYGLLSLIFISFVTFLADEIAPGDAALRVAGEKASLATIERVRHEMGLDRPWYTRYAEFAAKAARFDFGNSYFGAREPVSDVIKRSLPMTALIAGLAILLAAGVGIFLGTIAAVKQHKFADGAILSLSTLGVTVPNFVLAPILVYIFAVSLKILPTTWSMNRTAPIFFYLLLPVVILSIRPMAALTRLTRANMVDTLQQEFVRLAIAKGLPKHRVVVHHALRNAILPVITATGTSFGFLLTGSFIVERAFQLPGMGSEAIEAIQQQNTPVIQATVLVTGALFIGVNFLIDAILPLIDPRIRESQI